MVKGNWERRAELSSQRRKEEKRKKEARKAGVIDYTPRMICDILLQSQSEDLTMASATILAYLDESSGSSCLQHVRGFDGCVKKRCKLSHGSGQVGHLRGCNDGSELSSNTEKSISEGVSLRDLDKRMFDSILFLSVDGKLVFDYHYPENWDNYRRILNISATERAKDKPLLEEGEEDEEAGESGESGGSPGGKRKYSVGNEKELDLLDRRMRSTSICDSIDIDENENENEKESSPIQSEMDLEMLAPDQWKAFLKFAPTTLVDQLLRLLEVREICYLRGASSTIKNAISASPYARRELRSKSANSNEVKRKKQEKKKKQKNAFKSSNNKIDGFARGGNNA